MIKQKELVPKKRFEGFNEEWDKVNLGELVTIKSGWSPSNFDPINGENGSLFIKVDDLNYSFREQKTSNMRVLNNSRFEKMKKGSVIFPKRGAAILTNKVRITDSASYMDTNMMALEPENINMDFLYTFIGKTGLYKIADTSTVPQINNKHIEPYVINLPSTEEQQKIGQFFKHLDEMITLEQRKIDKTKALKSAYLAEMFPVEGEHVPKRRFAGFTDDWKKQKLGNITNYIKGFAFKSLEYRKKGIRIIRVSDLDKDSIKSQDDSVFLDYNAANLYEKYKINKNDIIITTVGSKAEMKESAVGRPIIIADSHNYLLNQNLVKINSKQKFNDYFIYSSLLQPNYANYIAMIERGNANQANIAINDLWDYEIKVPSKEEQRKIGSFFKNIDNTISNHQQKSEKLKATKQAYLNEMFV